MSHILTQASLSNLRAHKSKTMVVEHPQCSLIDLNPLLYYRSGWKPATVGYHTL